MEFKGNFPSVNPINTENTSEKEVSSNEKMASQLLNSLMFPDNKQSFDLSSIEGYNKANEELQKEISAVFDDLNLGKIIEEKLQAIPNPTEDQKLQLITDALFNYSYSKEHGGFETLFLEYVKSGKYGFNCEMSSAMLNEALLRQGYQPRIVKTVGNEDFIPDGDHYVSGLMGTNGKIKLIDLYKYNDSQNSARVFDFALIPVDGAPKINGEFFTNSENQNTNGEIFYVYPTGIKFDILQTLKSFDEIKKGYQTNASESSPFTSSISNIVSKYPEIKNFDLSKMKSKLGLGDPHDFLEASKH